MKQAIFPGSFDPITLGHLDLIERASQLTEHLIVAIAINKKKTPLFTAEQRISLIKKATLHLSNIQVISFEGLLVEFSQQQNTPVIIRGIRNTTDFEFELQLAMLNKKMQANLETLFFTPSEQHMYTSSSMVREIAAFDGPLTKLVPQCVIDALKETRNPHA